MPRKPKLNLKWPLAELWKREPGKCAVYAGPSIRISVNTVEEQMPLADPMLEDREAVAVAIAEVPNLIRAVDQMLFAAELGLIPEGETVQTARAVLRRIVEHDRERLKAVL